MDWPDLRMYGYLLKIFVLLPWDTTLKKSSLFLGSLTGLIVGGDLLGQYLPIFSVLVGGLKPYSFIHEFKLSK